MTIPLTSALQAPPANPLTSSAELAFQERVREFSASFPAALQPFQFWLVQQIVHNAMIVDQCRDEALGGTVSRRILRRGQFFPQFLGRQLEELPEGQRGQLQIQQAVRRLIFAAPGSELTKVPVQAFEVQ
jgi:hypothetical protein